MTHPALPHVARVLVVAGALLTAHFSIAATVAVIGGTVHSIDGPPIEKATVIIRDGVISAVGLNVAIPSDALRIDAAGRVVTPGLFDPYTQLGIQEIESVVPTRDGAANAVAGLSAAFDVSSALNANSTLIPVSRVEGVTRAMVAPSNGTSVFAGQGALMQLDERLPLVTHPRQALFALLGANAGKIAGGSRAAALQQLESAFTQADEYQRRETGTLRPIADYTWSRADLNALSDAKRARRILAINVDRASDILTAIDLKKRVGMPVVIVRGREAWQVARQLAAAQIPVILIPTDNLPLDFDSLGARLDNAALLHQAGVHVAFTDEETQNARKLRQQAGNAVANGLPWDAALAAITSVPAEVWGVGDRIGKLKAGYAGDVVIWNGDPLELSTWAETVIVNGAVTAMDSRQIRLRERYRDLQDAALPHAYR